MDAGSAFLRPNNTTRPDQVNKVISFLNFGFS